MCWEIDYKFLAEQQRKSQEARVKQEQRELIVKELLNEANKKGEEANTELPHADEVASAK